MSYISEQHKIALAKETLAVITDTDENYSYRRVFDPQTGKLTTYLGYGEESVETWTENNKERILKMMQYMEEGPYADNKKAFYNMIFENGNGMVPLWNTGVDQYIDRINGSQGLRPIMRETMSELNALIVSYRAEFDNLAMAAQVDTD